MKKPKPIRFPVISIYHTIALYRVETKLRVGRCITPITLFSAHDLSSDVSKSKVDAIEALRSLSWHLVACELLMNKCKEKGIPFKMAEELPADELILQKAREGGVVLRAVYFDSQLYDKVDRSLQEDGLYDGLAKGVEGLRALVEKGKAPVREVPPVKNTDPGEKAFRQHLLERKGGRGR